MNDQAILEQIAQNPKCRAVQIADRLNLDLVDVQASLAGLIAVGDVVTETGTSPAGTPCQLYDLSAHFKDSDAYKPILTKALAVQFAAFRPDLGKTDRAIEFVRERGTVTSSELHAVLGLAPDEYASSFLASAVRNGRLVKDGKTWALGPNAPDRVEPDPVPVAQPKPEAAPVAPAPKPVEVPVFADKAAAQPLQPLQQLKESLRQPVPVTVPSYRFAIWSDGLVEIQRNGTLLTQLPREVADQFANFVRRPAQ